MKDRLKFRAWHKPTKKMFKVFCFIDKEVFENTIDGVGATPTNPANIDDCVIMQCTGLKDKNGKLIYEGDIVKFYEHNYEVYFNENTSAMNIWNEKKELGYSLYYHEELEVIGNIHENPELLKE